MWLLAIALAPIAAASGAASPLVAVMYHAAGLVCHQRPERSFHLAGIAMPVCARCFGLYAAAAVGSALGWVGSRAGGTDSSASRRRLLAVASVPTAVTVALEWLGLANPSSVVRALSALPLGAAAAWMFVRMLRERPNTTGVPADAI